MYRRISSLAFLISVLFCSKCYCQSQDVTFHLNTTLLAGQKVLKVKRDFNDPYLWVLAANNQVYRVNSLTMAIDNYTTAFAAYNNLQFIDIAGRSQDTVFIATNSTNVIEYKNGALRLIGAADGIPGTVNSVGIASYSATNFNINTSNVMIATNNGFCQYDSNAETLTIAAANANSKVYEATYWTEFYKDSSAATSDPVTTDTIQYQPVTYILPVGPVVVGYLWEGGKEFGYNINSGLVVYDAIYGYNEVFSNYFWGDSRGLFQNFSNFSYYSIFEPAGHYLNGINVNKVTHLTHV